jgi:hypothetical protein
MEEFGVAHHTKSSAVYLDEMQEELFLERFRRGGWSNPPLSGFGGGNDTSPSP